MDHDTDIGGRPHRFPVTRQSAIVAARSGDQQEQQRAFESIIAGYWKPAYKYIRIKWQASNEDAKDLTQGFFALAIEKNYFANYDSTRASFQTYLRTCLDGFVANRKKAETRLKRGGDSKHLSLDFAGAENELALQNLTTNTTPEDYFHREWVRNLFALAVETLHEQYAQAGHGVHFKLFETYDLRDEALPRITYADLARDFALSITDVNNHLAAVRRDFRKIVLAKLRELSGTEAEFRQEARNLLGVRIK